MATKKTAKTTKKKADAKTYVLDTNVLIADPDCLLRFEDNHVVIPDAAIEELDNHKKDPGDVGYNVRKMCRLLDQLSISGKNEISLGECGGTLSFCSEMNFANFPESWDYDKNDNRILAITNAIPGAILVSRDTNIRIKARLLGIEAQNYRHEAVEEDFLTYRGRTSAVVKKKEFEMFASGEDIPASCLVTDNKDEVIHENEFVVISAKNDADQKLFGVVKNGMLQHLKYNTSKPFGIMPRNLGQHFALEALLTPASEVPLVILTGSAGTAKTFLTLACGLEQVMEKRMYRKITLTRANTPFDNEIGALPGSEVDKIGPLLRGSMDNLEQLICGRGVRDSEEEYQNTVQYVFDKGYVKAEALEYIRGRSMTDQILFVDECQNTTQSQMNAILSRPGEGVKLVLAGDLNQIDTPRLDRHNNGLAHAIKMMMGDTDCFVVGFTDEEATRSRLAAKIAAKISGEKA